MTQPLNSFMVPEQACWVPNCDECIENDRYNCKKCSNGQFITNGGKYCMPCNLITHCNKCADFDGCVSCDRGFYIYKPVVQNSYAVCLPNA